VLRVRGSNFCYSSESCAPTAYSCEFRSGTNATALATAVATNVTDAEIECTVPAWPYASPATLNVVVVNNILSRAVRPKNASATRFTFRPILTNLSSAPCAACACRTPAPCLASAAPQELALVGAGFDRTLTGYHCSVEVVRFGGGVSTITSPAVRPSSEGGLACLIPGLPRDVVAQVALLSLFSPSLDLIPSRLPIEFFPQWSAISPARVYANGCASPLSPCPHNHAVVELSTHGLSPASLYRCDFLAADGRRGRGRASQPLSPSRLFCWLPEWNHSAAELEVTLLTADEE
ncbi:hypothetical protein T484DRAFT_1791210, partial [Baffinella frigidus]